MNNRGDANFGTFAVAVVILMAIIVSCAGCSTTVPVKRKFPDVPSELMETCPELKEVSETTKLSDVLSVVVSNYGLYHECAIKSDAWIEWYKTQKEIFESVK